MKNIKQSIPMIYESKPIFGIDIGFNTVKVMQIDSSRDSSQKPRIKGYGVAPFDQKAIKNGIVNDYKEVARAIKELFADNVVGTIDTKRAVATIPASRAYSRVLNQPANLSKKELREAVLLEAAQYIPIPLDDLYIDHSIVSRNSQTVDILLVAAPKTIIDSYVNLFKILDIELSAIETNTLAASRIITYSEKSNDIPTILIDLGSLSVDLTVYDNNLVINSTIPGGGDDFTNLIAEKLNIEKKEADRIKTKFGLGVSKYQKDIREALRPQIDSMIKEVKRVCRYYQEKTNGSNTIGQVITMGGGSNMPGLVDYLTDSLRIPTRLCSFWSNLDSSTVNMPIDAEKTLYVTVAGSALLDPGETLL